MSWIHCTKFSRQTQLIFANCTIFFQKNSISHHHFIQKPHIFVLIVVNVSILLNIYNNLHHLLTIPDKNHHLSPNCKVQLLISSPLCIFTHFPHLKIHSVFALCIFFSSKFSAFFLQQTALTLVAPSLSETSGNGTGYLYARFGRML